MDLLGAGTDASLPPSLLLRPRSDVPGGGPASLPTGRAHSRKSLRNPNCSQKGGNRPGWRPEAGGRPPVETGLRGRCSGGPVSRSTRRASARSAGGGTVLRGSLSKCFPQHRARHQHPTAARGSPAAGLSHPSESLRSVPAGSERRGSWVRAGTRAQGWRAGPGPLSSKPPPTARLQRARVRLSHSDQCALLAPVDAAQAPAPC